MLLLSKRRQKRQRTSSRPLSLTEGRVKALPSTKLKVQLRGVVMTDRELEEVLQEMDLPPKRRDLTKAENLGWLNRNIAVRNSRHPRIAEVTTTIHQKLKEV
jgi:hypothetical protein